MSAQTGKRFSHKRLIVEVIALCIGGFAPLVTGVVGMWSFIERGYFVSKTGDLIAGPLAIFASVAFIFAGLGLIAYAIWNYRRKRMHHD
ncbi:MAG: hypothetical protein R3307_08130 [Anaerolineales bacterium]|nr:hypothetical protein [Anaerolineales bacterium]